MFLETPRFPACPSFGFISDPMYLVAINERASGIESRNRQWSRPRYTYTATLGPRVEADVYEAYEYYHAVGGTAYGFRFKDYVDYKSCMVGQVPTATDQPIGLDTTADPPVYQLIKLYTAGALTQVREIYKPVENTILIADGGTLKVSGTHYILDHTAGTVEFLYTPVGALTWGGEFDVPVRFDSTFPVEILNRKIQSASFTLRELRREE